MPKETAWPMSWQPNHRYVRIRSHIPIISNGAGPITGLIDQYPHAEVAAARGPRSTATNFRGGVTLRGIAAGDAPQGEV